MSNLRQAAQQALESIDWLRHHLIQHHGCLHMDPTASGIPAWLNKNEAALRAALAEPCPCGDRPAAQCPGEWEPGCDLGNNPKYAKRVEMTPKELAASIKRGEKWKVAEPVQENKDA